MKTLVYGFLLIICFAGFVPAQDEKPITEWAAFDRPDVEFSLQIPKGFEFGSPGLPFDKVMARGEFHSDRDRFYIFVDSPKEPGQRKQVEAYLRYAGQSTVSFDLAGQPAGKVEFEDPTGYYHRVVFVATPDRLFTLQTVSRHKNSEDAVRFINSFRLLPKPASETSPERPRLEVNPNADAVFSIETTTPATQPVSRGGGIGAGSGSGYGSGIGTGSGSGSGSGNGSGSGTAGPPTVPSKTTSPLRITSKQKAVYTDFARFYMIQGNVTLRVTFLAKGEIGSITPVRTLPFGLTETATYAARNIGFEPEVANGVVRTTTRPVSFTFNIY